MRKFLAVALVCLAALGGSVAHAAGQLRADEKPVAEGPVYDSGTQQCDEQTLESGGKPVIKVAFCIFFYNFDPLFELDLNNDYGVVWAQATFDALPGYCTTELSFYVEMPDGTVLYERAPQKAVAAKRKTPAVVEVNALANGNAIQPAKLSQELQLLPGKVTPTGSGEEPRVGVAWKGRSPAKLAFATGAEISWPWLSGPPAIRLGADTIRLTSGKGC
ncbi:MAG TPA: hypothetical protein VEU29_07160 [Actinomycetota bacterium]|nr:hypothetical protein [Actinomycetota bacterium]